MTNPDTFYVTAGEYRSETEAPTLVEPLTHDEVTSLLLRAMTEIDAFIGDGWTPLVEDQEFIFPRDIDEETGIPRPLHLATVMIADAILRAKQQRSTSGVLAHEIKSETNLGHSYTRADAKKDKKFGHWPDEAVELLEQYRLFPAEFGVNQW